MPRIKLSYETKAVLVTIPLALEKKMREALFDESKGRVPGGAVSKYIESLIKRDLERTKGLSLDDLIEGESNE